VSGSYLSESSSLKEVLDFFDEFGTHGFQDAGFGGVCAISIFMESGGTAFDYSSFISEESSSSLSFVGFEAGFQEGQTDVSSKTS